jgi:large subunit ribosomal protein L4
MADTEKKKAANKADEAKAAGAGKAAGTRRKKKDPIADADTADVGTAAKDFAKSAIDVFNTNNEKVSNIVLHPEVFRARVNEHLLYEAVKQYRAGARRGTHMTKNRALVSGSGKKPWRQKGTGRARVGEIRNPLWRHGGTVFGPTPRDYSYDMPKKARAAALRSALSKRAQDGGLKVVDHFDIAQPKTRELKAILVQLGVGGKTLLVDDKPADNLILSGRNIPGLKVVDATQVNVYDVLDCQTVLVSQEALTKLEERLTP